VVSVSCKSSNIVVNSIVSARLSSMAKSAKNTTELTGFSRGITVVGAGSYNVDEQI